MGLFSAPKIITVRYKPGSKSGGSVASSSSTSSKRSHRSGSTSSSSSTAPSSASSSSSRSSSSKRSSSSRRSGGHEDEEFDYESHKRDEARRAHKLAKRLEEKERERQAQQQADLIVQPEYLNPSQFAEDQWSRHRGLNDSYYNTASSLMGSSSRASDYHGSSTSAYKRRPREGFIKALLHKLRKLIRKLFKFVKRHPIKIFFWLILPLISGGFIVSFFRRFDIKMPALLTMALGGLTKTITSKHAKRALNGAGLKDFDFSEGASLSTVLKVVRHLM